MSQMTDEFAALEDYALFSSNLPNVGKYLTCTCNSSSQLLINKPIKLYVFLFWIEEGNILSQLDINPIILFVI